MEFNELLKILDFREVVKKELEYKSLEVVYKVNLYYVLCNVYNIIIV